MSVPEREGGLRGALAATAASHASLNARAPAAAGGSTRKRALRLEPVGVAAPARETSVAAAAGGSRLSWQTPDTTGYPGLRVQIPAAAARGHHHHHHHHHENQSHNHHHHHHDHGEQASKRPRREPSSPTSVGDIDDPKAIPRCVHTTLAEPPAALQQSAAPMLLLPAPPPPVVTPAANPPTVPSITARPAAANPAKMQSVIRGLQHLSACASGCANPLCVSTRNFVEKVAAHLAAMSQRAAHDAGKCGACQLWAGIVASHTQTCRATGCAVPLCAQRKQQK